MKKSLFLALCAASITFVHAKLYMPAKPVQVSPQTVSWFERVILGRQAAQAPYIPTMHVGLLNIIKDIERYEDILLPLTKFVENDYIDAIIIRIDSTGGSPADAQIIAHYIRAAQQQKPIIAFISHNGTSSAYWIASACSYIVCPSAAEVSHIGIVYQMVFDKDKRYYVIGSGEFKAPELGKEQEVSAEYIKHLKTGVQETAIIFAQEVSENRNIPLETIVSWQAAVFTGTTALKLGLVDQNGTMQELLEKTVQLVTEKNNTEYQQLNIVNTENTVIKTYQL